MSTPDARIATTLPTHPKTKKLLRRLGFEGGWCLVRLILWAASSRTDGNLEGLSDEDIELAVDWSGEEGAFVGALADVRFLDGPEGARVIHDWSEHNPWAAGASERSERSTFGALVKQHGRQEAERRMPEYAERLRQAAEERAGRKQKGDDEQAGGMPSSASGSATGNDEAVPNPASGTAGGTNSECPVSNTVSVSDTVSISNSKEEQEQGAPPVDGAVPAAPSKKINFATWLASLPPGAPAIPEDHPVFRYADSVGMPADFVDLAWEWFKRKYLAEPRKRYIAWPRHFQNSVEGAWGGLWRIDAAGEYFLTTEGKQLQRSLEAEDNGAARQEAA